MSKVIKARFVVKDEHNHLKHWNQETSPKKTEQCSPAHLFETNAEALLYETKIMLDELIVEGQQKADRIILQAKEQAEEHLSKSRAESQAIRDTAYQEGFESGHAQAKTLYEKEIKAAHEASLSMLEQIRTERDRYLKEQEKEIIELVFVLLEKIVGTVIEGIPEAMGRIIENLLEQVKENEKVIIHVNPIHIPYLCGFDGHFRERFTDRFQIIDDTEIPPGNCQIITENGFVDSKIDEQIILLKQALLEVVGHDGN